jgi:hypothetical protein
MIQKEPRKSKVHRLRVIHIYEADYNFLLQAKWHDLLCHSEKHKLLYPANTAADWDKTLLSQHSLRN